MCSRCSSVNEAVMGVSVYPGARTFTGDARCEDDELDGAELTLDLREGIIDRCAVDHIAVEGEEVGGRRRVTAGDRDTMPVLGQLSGRSKADTAPTANNQSCSSHGS